ncbi:hypothetical protein B0T20DRAFT_453370 [Sordaria brevicollis]|uniref:Protein kinase domain-containing protein n=1 Tax=Sordaria brevicollis TaxID=83679 RepID=A0AAE0UC39_SORBR|nr:hypothetical protein B0T20DRAFT_453370 [Sordaria brevicollis]
MHLWRDHKDGGGGVGGQGAHDAGPGLGLGSAGTAATEPGSGAGGHGPGHEEEGNTATTSPGSQTQQQQQQHDDGGSNKQGTIRRNFRKVVPGLPRAQTFKRQQSEQRDHLQPVQPTPAERRAASVDRRMHATNSASASQVGLGVAGSLPRSSAPNFHHHFGRSSHISHADSSVPSLPAIPQEHATGNSRALNGHELEEELDRIHNDQQNRLLRAPGLSHVHAGGSDVAVSDCDAHSITSSQYHNMIHDELEKIWILNLSMHFRDKSKREKFFVTYRQHESLWRRVTISLDYRDAQEGSLEEELVDIKFQRDKSSRIYEAIRDSLADIQFYPTVTNLKLQTTDGRLHVHVVEDVNEIISYPTVRMIQHMRCRRIKESEVEFDSHLSGFVYKVRVNGETLIKKEIPGPDTVDEFLYEINALNRLHAAENVIEFYGVIVDESGEHVKGLLISFAEHGALIDIIYDYQLQGGLPWSTRERWARQIVSGLADIHEAGFVQGDFTLSNIVINNEWNAKIIDINRRGCPVGWEPPEATPLIESSQRISMYIGVKSDLYQLGMVLWALATQEDEPEAHGRPLRIGPEVTDVPDWYVEIVNICLDPNPRKRRQAMDLLDMFPEPEPVEQSQYSYHNPDSVSVDDGYRHQEYLVGTEPTNGVPKIIKTVDSPSNREWDYFSSNVGGGGIGRGRQDAISPAPSEDQHWYPPRGRSPPSPLPSDGGYDDPARFRHHLRPWGGNSSTYQEPSNLTVPSSYADRQQASSYTDSDVGESPLSREEEMLKKALQQHDPRISSTSFISTAPSGDTDAASTPLKDSILREALKWRPDTAPSSAPMAPKSHELTLREQYDSESPSSNTRPVEPEYSTTQSHHQTRPRNHYTPSDEEEDGSSRREPPLSRADSGKYFTEPTTLKPSKSGHGPDLAYAAINEARDRDRFEHQFKMEAAEAMAGRYHGQHQDHDHGHQGQGRDRDGYRQSGYQDRGDRNTNYSGNGNGNGNSQLERDREREYERYGGPKVPDVLKGVGGAGIYDLALRDSRDSRDKGKQQYEVEEEEIDMDLFAGQRQHHNYETART